MAVSWVVTQTSFIPMANAALPKRLHCGERLATNGTMAIKLHWHCNRVAMKTELAALDGSLELVFMLLSGNKRGRHHEKTR
jgi:hypothetical protein